MLLPDNKSDHMQQGLVTLHHITYLQEHCLSMNTPGTMPKASQDTIDLLDFKRFYRDPAIKAALKPKTVPCHWNKHLRHHNKQPSR